MADLALVGRARAHGDRTAVEASEGTYTYRDLLAASHRVAAALLEESDDLHETRVAFLVPSGFDHVAVQWGIWRAGGIAVPMAVSHPPPELQYVIEDADAQIVVAHPDRAQKVLPFVDRRPIRFLTSREALETPGDAQLPAIAESRRAMMVHTSGTTGRPKGVVTTHRNIRAQVTALIEAWEWTPNDRILLVLPLHHVHGIVNVLTCALWAGAVCEMMPKFDLADAWQRIVRGDLTLLMAVPTIYGKLIAAWEAAPPKQQEAMSEACRRMRLMVSGSAALPTRTLERWQEISGHVLLERYGMTEIGMALSNPLHGERVPGSVGGPLPRVELRLVHEDGNVVTDDGTPGEIQVRGPNVFLEYWRRPNATKQAFLDGWFRTGDLAVVEHGRYRILGRSSVDIIKTGGYKVSALEIEEVLRTHPQIAECAVVGIDDVEWGERICVAAELRGPSELTLEQLCAWAKERLAPYKVPRALRCMPTLPRNAMGKVTKPDVKRLFGEGIGE
jgi:malonyl-CoA/methylmalonyl-CoA synthetase